MSAGILSEPVVYVERGTPNQFAMLLRSVAALVTHEPSETFANDAVRAASDRLSHLLAFRMDPGEDAEPSGEVE